ncbi:MAG: hypothetical protein HZA54_14660 [Planctomycetes bacterium]|nr:hypothetical protein [Planctomycetota bacterium]
MKRNGVAWRAAGLALAAGVALMGCRGTANHLKGEYFHVQGFYLFPLTQIHVGMSHAQVQALLGAPALQLREADGFRAPVRVKLATLPAFDEQWGWLEGLANNWVFFRDGKVTAAFREESDW